MYIPSIRKLTRLFCITYFYTSQQPKGKTGVFLSVINILCLYILVYPMLFCLCSFTNLISSSERSWCAFFHWTILPEVSLPSPQQYPVLLSKEQSPLQSLKSPALFGAWLLSNSLCVGLAYHMYSDIIQLLGKQNKFPSSPGTLHMLFSMLELSHTMFR